MPNITDLINSLRGLELPKGAEALLGAVEREATALTTDRDDAVAKLKTRQDENAKLKDRAQKAEEERDGLKATLPDGSVVLSRAEADALTAYQALGKPDEVKTALEQGAQAAKNAHRADVRDGLRQLGYDPSDRLLRDFEGVTLSVADSSDKKSKVGTVKVGDAEKPFAEWAKEAGLESDLERYRAQPPGVPVLGQVRGETPGPVSVGSKTAQDLQAARDAVPNPLLPKPNPT